MVQVGFHHFSRFQVGLLGLPPVTTLYNSRLIFMVFKIPDWFFMVPMVFMVIQGSRLVFIVQVGILSFFIFHGS